MTRQSRRRDNAEFIAKIRAMTGKRSKFSQGGPDPQNVSGAGPGPKTRHIADLRARRGRTSLRVKKSIRKRLVAQLDQIFSLYIRLRDKRTNSGMCFLCPKPIEQCFHFLTRAAYSTRWDPFNAAGSCAGHNLRHEFDPYPAYSWYRKKYGDGAFDNLYKRHKAIAKWENSDLIAMRDNLKRELGER